MVDSVGDRVGEQEFREIEEEHQLRQGMKKFGKNKDLRIGLLMLLTTINQVGSTATEVKEKDETDWDMDDAMQLGLRRGLEPSQLASELHR